MKTKLITAAALVLATTSGAFAMSAHDVLSPSDAYEVKRYVPQADLTSLTPGQIAMISAALHNGSEDGRGYQIRSILQ
ncbi:MAG: hypothetical protein KDE03_13710 [Rhodobacteraceae bacterium]|nr:hypothetical protein [Paracoccaceae bacterium]